MYAIRSYYDYVQVGAFAERNNAEKLERRLKDAGFSDSFVFV